MSRHHRPKAFWRLARIWFRHIRITFWLLILLLLVVLLYLHNIGLPGFARQAVIRAFESKGVELSFSQLHLAWFKDIVAEEVSLQPAGTDWVPRIECKKVDLSFDPFALLQFKIVPRDLSITDGQLILPYPETNGLPGRLTATNLQALIQFVPGVGVSVESLKGVMVGCSFSASGTLANLALVRDWPMLQERADHSRSPAHEIWRSVSQVSRKMEYQTAPELRAEFDLDGAAPQRLEIHLSLEAGAAVSPWGEFENLRTFAKLSPMNDGVSSEINVVLQADRIVSEFGRGDNILGACTLACAVDTGTLSAGHTTLSAGQLDTVWAGASDFVAALDWHYDGTNQIPMSAELEMGAAELSTTHGWAGKVRAGIQLTPFKGDHRQILELPEFIFADLEPFEIKASFEVERVETPWLSVSNLGLVTTWSAPELVVTNLSLDCAGGQLGLAAVFDSISGQVQFRGSSNLDPKRMSSALPAQAMKWMDLVSWKTAPMAHGAGTVTLPERHRYQLLWPGDLTSSLHGNGYLLVRDATVRGIPLPFISSHVVYSNRFMQLPDLTIRRPDGELRLGLRNNDRTGRFELSVDGAMDPTPALALVPDNAVEARNVLGTFHFGASPEVHLELSGSWNDPATLMGGGTLHATDLQFRGQSLDQLDTAFGLTNLILTIIEPRAKAGQGEGSASLLTFNFSENVAFLSNGVSTLPPMMVATAIGKDVVRAIQPYHFLNPPDAQVEGVIPLKGSAGADLRFHVKGGPFEWTTFDLSEVDARVRWAGDTVAIDLRHAGFYDGTASGQGFFDFTGKRDADFWFNLLVDEADIQQLVTGVFQSTNRLEGRLSGNLSITNANTDDFQSWFGYGHAKLKDGFLWSVPVFGIVSPVLEVFVPGLGNSRAKEAEGRFVITNSVIRTEDLLIHASNMRLLYAGTVDFRGNVNAVAEAEILRDTFVVGEIVSVALTPLSKAMIIEITGTLNDPNARPLYLVPRLLLAPLNPVKLFKDLFAPSPGKGRASSSATSEESKPEVPLQPPAP